MQKITSDICNNYIVITLQSYSNHSFYKYHDIKKFDYLSLKSKDSFLVDFFNDLEIGTRVKTQKRKNKREKKQMCIIQLWNYIMRCQESF